MPERRCALTAQAANYWGEVGQAWAANDDHALWRRHSDAVNGRLLQDWLPNQAIDIALKTDLFDEAVGNGLFPLLAARARRVIGIDIAQDTIQAAQDRYPELRALVADVRCLPLASDTFDVVISNSTLDHFATSKEITTSLTELWRVLRPGGSLILTLDNPANPKLALRSLLPFRWLNWLGVVPYFVGATMGSNQLKRALRQAGFEVVEARAVMHCPRILAVAVAGWLHKLAAPSMQSSFLKWLMRFEMLNQLPTRYQTGHFVAVLALKR